MLNIITNCVRPQNLEKIHTSICEAQATSEIKPPIRWIIVLDERAQTEFLFLAELLKTMKLSFEPTFKTDLVVNPCVPVWDAPMNLGFSMVKEGLVCAIDDDNIMHPDFMKCIYPYYLEGVKGFLYHQLLSVDKSYNRRVRYVKPVKIEPGKIDTAQFCLDKSLFGPYKWSTKTPQPDGVFIRKVYTKFHQSILILDEILCYYNYLTPKFRV